MKLSPSEISSRDFTRSLRGYDPAEVRAFLNDVSELTGDLAANVSSLQTRITGLEAQLRDYTTMEKAIQQTFLQAQETSGKAVDSARREAQMIIQEAEGKASQILDGARTELAHINEQITLLRTKRESIVSKLKHLLESELNTLRTLSTDGDGDAPAGPAGDDTVPVQVNAKPDDQASDAEIDDILKRLENE